MRFALIVAWFALASPGFAQDRIQIVTTTTDLRTQTEIVGGERVVAVSVVSPNMDAEEYQAKPQDVLRLKNAERSRGLQIDHQLELGRLHDR